MAKKRIRESKPRKAKKLKNSQRVFADTQEPHERYPGESPQRWEAFEKYRNQRGRRSLAKVAAELGKSAKLIERWSQLDRWRFRCESYDSYLAKKNTQVLAKYQEQYSARQMKAGRLLSHTGFTALQAKFGKNLERLDANSMTTAEALKAIELGMKLQREIAVVKRVEEDPHGPQAPAGQVIEGTVIKTDEQQQPANVLPLTYSERVDEALAILDAARAREVARVTGESARSEVLPPQTTS